MEEYEIIACFTDVDGNCLKVKKCNNKSPKVKFCKAKKQQIYCGNCLKVRNDFDNQKYGERWIVLNRDMSGERDEEKNFNSLISLLKATKYFPKSHLQRSHGLRLMTHYYTVQTMSYLSMMKIC